MEFAQFAAVFIASLVLVLWLAGWVIRLIADRLPLPDVHPDVDYLAPRSRRDRSA